jgi:hypothetical protein
MPAHPATDEAIPFNRAALTEIALSLTTASVMPLGSLAAARASKRILPTE